MFIFNSSFFIYSCSVKYFIVIIKDNPANSLDLKTFLNNFITFQYGGTIYLKSFSVNSLRFSVTKEKISYP